MSEFKLNPYRIGFRTFKTAIGMTLGVILAQLLGTQNYASAALLVVLSIKSTKVKSINAAISRLAACFIALLFSYVFFESFGYNAIILGLLVLFFIPTTVMFKVQEGVVTACVIIIHCFISEHMTVQFIKDEIILIFIGLTIGFILNLFMPNRQAELEKYKKNIETDFQLILSQCSDALKFLEIHLRTEGLDHLKTYIEKAKSEAFLDVENHFVRNDNSYYYYFTMRQKQLVVLYRIVSLINDIKTSDEVYNHYSELLEQMSQGVSSTDTTAIRLHQLYQLQLQLKEEPLPSTHKALYSKSAAIQLLNELETYLIIKSNFGSLKA